MATNLISFLGTNERVEDVSALRLYTRISSFTSSLLEPTTDEILISRPVIKSRSSASHMLLLSINRHRLLAFKRCYDSPDFIGRELAIAEARRVIGFPDYSVMLLHGLSLKCDGAQDSCSLTRGWEDKDFLIIDFGLYGDREDLSHLDYSLVHDIGEFITQLGGWAAFNYLFVVRDRHPGNFLYEKSTGLVYSIDNEEGPFDAFGRAISPNDIILQIRELMKKVLSLGDRESLSSSFRAGFIKSWLLIADKLKYLTLISQKELILTNSLLEQDPNSIVDSLTT